MSEKVETVGPFGGEGSLIWDDGAHSTIREIVVYASSVIESIQVEYDDNGSSVLAEKHGYSEDGNKETVELDYPDEFLISVSGYLGGSNLPIHSLTFESNRRTYGPFGTQNGEYFKIQSSNGNKIIGFHGMSDYQVDGLGAYFEVVGDQNSGDLFGGQGGNSWDDGVHTTIRKLIVFYSENGLNAIEIEYDDNGKSKWSNRHGKRRDKKESVELDYPDEFLISISGYTGPNSFSTTVVRSITFESNRRTYGPFGTETDTPFKFPSTSSGSMIVGFHGRSGDNVDAIGAHLGPISSSSVNPPPIPNVNPSPSPRQWITVGPYGGTGGSRWDDGVYDGVRQVIVFTSAVIESIQIEYEKNGQPTWSQIHGRGNGIRNIVTLDSPNEYLISVSGHIGLYYSMTVIRSLTLATNRRTYGPFGTPDGQYNFNISSSNDIKVLGFFGSSGDYLDHIGAYLSTRAQAPQWVSIGPYGGTGGNRWDDGVQTGVRQVVVFASEVIKSIQIQYDKNGQPNWSEIHGRGSGTRETVQLDYPNEYLVSVTGYIGLYYSMTLIRSLTLKSNRRTYGPFGTPNGTYDFTISSSNNDKILGFFGSSGDSLDHIGAYVSKQVQSG